MIAKDGKPTIRRVELASKAFYLSQCPPESPNLPEIAVFGRSNVGKSSLINFICGRKLLATISKRPGHTRLVHHFLVDKSWYLVDLPGIGFAEGSRSQLKDMDRIVNAYVRHRSTLIELFYLVDASVPPQDIDLQGIRWLADAGTYLSVVFTKTDKDRRGSHRHQTASEALENALWEMNGSPWRLGIQKEMPRMFLTSSVQRTGREVLLQHIHDLRQRSRPRIKGTAEATFAAKSMGKKAMAMGPPPSIR